MFSIRTIYRIINIATGKSYIGQSANTLKRKIQHFSNLACGRHENDYLQKSYNKYGLSFFKFEIIEDAENLSFEELNDREIFWISFYDSFNNGYNLTIGGDGTKGRAFSAEERIIRSKKMTGNGNHFFGKTHTLETRKKISISQSLRTGPKNSFYGKSHSKDWKDKRQLLYKKKKAAGWISPNKGIPKPSQAVELMKRNMPHRKAIIVDGKEYESISEASKILGLHRSTIRLRLGRDDYPNYQYK